MWASLIDSERLHNAITIARLLFARNAFSFYGPFGCLRYLENFSGISPFAETIKDWHVFGKLWVPSVLVPYVQLNCVKL